MSKLQGKVALITGGSRGIGATIAQRFADEGASVAITYVGQKAAADALLAKLQAAGTSALAVHSWMLPIRFPKVKYGKQPIVFGILRSLM